MTRQFQAPGHLSSIVLLVLLHGRGGLAKQIEGTNDFEGTNVMKVTSVITIFTITAVDACT